MTAQVPDKWSCESDAIWKGDATSDHLGHHLSSGDWDGDGLDDILSGSIDEAADLGSATLMLSAHIDGAAHVESSCFRIEGLAAPDWGVPVAFTGDFNGGGKDDIAVGEPGWRFDVGSGDTQYERGRVLVFFAEKHETCTDLTPADADLIFEGDEARRWFGASIDAAGDIDGDGTPDLIIGAPGDPDSRVPIDGGKAYIYTSATAMVQWMTQGSPTVFQCIGCDYELPPTSETYPIGIKDRYGFTVAGAGDVNGDGYDDVAVGAIQARHISKLDYAAEDSGYALLYLNPTQPGVVLSSVPDLPLVTVSPTLDVQMTGDPFLFGFSICGNVDLNADNRPDVLVGSPLYIDTSSGPGVSNDAGNRGAVYAYTIATDDSVSAAYGLDSQPLMFNTPDDDIQPFPAEIDGRVDAYFGWSLAPAGQFNAGEDFPLIFEDFLVGAPRLNNEAEVPSPCDDGEPTGGAISGRVYVISGANPALMTSDFPRRLFIFRGEAGEEDGRARLGIAVASGHVLNTGRLDQILGASGYTEISSTITETGRVYLFEEFKP